MLLDSEPSNECSSTCRVLRATGPNHPCNIIQPIAHVLITMMLVLCSGLKNGKGYDQGVIGTSVGYYVTHDKSRGETIVCVKRCAGPEYSTQS